jgi:serine/threonine-protein kinase
MSFTRPPKLARDPDLRVAPVARPGALIDGRYRIESVVGRGGMGLVVAARDEATGARVAVKLLLPYAGDPAHFERRALREARAAAALESEHATRVLDVGRLDTGLPYMVMELLEGTDFERLLAKRGTLSVGEVATCLVQACDAIVEAHARGIVHRDLKPSNLFQTRRSDGTSLIKLMDFGISKLVGADAGGALTPTADSPGTPRYMSPEQLLSARRVDCRTDVWALGVIAFRMLSGRYPFDGETAAAVHIAIASTPAPSLRDVAPETPAPIVRIVDRCLAKSPAERLPTARAFAAALLPYADTDTQRRWFSVLGAGESSAAAREPMGQVLRLGARGRTDRAAAGGLLAAVAHVAIGLWAAGWPSSLWGRAWAGAELGVMPLEDVSSPSTEIMLDPSALAWGDEGEIGGRTAAVPDDAPHAGFDAPGGRGGKEGLRSAVTTASSTRRVDASPLHDPFTDWLRRAYGTDWSGAVPPGAGRVISDTSGGGNVNAPGPGEVSAVGGPDAEVQTTPSATQDGGGQRGILAEKQPMLRGRARPAMLLPNWGCEYPEASRYEGTVRLIATVRPDGTAESVEVLFDPGHGFAEVARECAMRQPFLPALDERGQGIRSKTRPFTVHFVR